MKKEDFLKTQEEIMKEDGKILKNFETTIDKYLEKLYLIEDNTENN